MRTYLRSLRGRITLVTVSVAMLAVLATGLISLQLVRVSTINEAKAQLAAQADVLSKLRAAATITDLSDRVKLALGDTEVALVRRNGQVVGGGAPYIDQAMARRLIRGNPVSTVRRSGGETVVIEGRTTPSGAAIVLVRSQASLERTTQQTASRILIALLVGIVLAVIAGALLGRWIAKPLVTTAATARRMGAGERGLPITAHRPTEIADVADALASLDHALTTSEGRQREFLLSISHELRTPLTAVRGYGEAMTDGLIHEADIASVGATLVAETERLDRFVADLLELARLEADDFVIHRQPLDVAALLDEAGQAWLGRCATLGVALAVAADHATIVTDGRRVRQVLDGLVENALRVTPAGAGVQLHARAEGTDVVLEVRDGGPGLSADDLRVAFERGALHARYRDIRPVGTGLGLSIASRLVSRLGGSIVAGNAPGGGAVFTVRLPAA
ncbi:ATP-binding protein [Lacisediminihabitans sp.]|uniref:HAMP domain-containing sensor histidine kinase n=1 Tax=Lacisediminihabitans sp. TaxID=2787631 RepID=UPI00374D1250